MRPNEDLTQRDIETRGQLPEILESAVNLLRTSHTTPLRKGFLLTSTDTSNELINQSARVPVLHPYKADKSPPDLVLSDLKGNVFDLDSSRKQVVLVNFWATWCRPCVEEIPSLSRLVDRMQGKPFKVVAVNIGESAADIKKFVKSIPVNFDILLDSNGHAVRDWKVYAYPSNYLLDKNGQIQFSYRGALEWDAPEIVNTIETLF
jgi:thiol-disulfide isomerase/thioredoxin